MHDWKLASTECAISQLNEFFLKPQPQPHASCQFEMCQSTVRLELFRLHSILFLSSYSKRILPIAATLYILHTHINHLPYLFCWFPLVFKRELVPININFEVSMLGYCVKPVVAYLNWSVTCVLETSLSRFSCGCWIVNN